MKKSTRRCSTLPPAPGATIRDIGAGPAAMPPGSQPAAMTSSPSNPPSPCARMRARYTLPRTSLAVRRPAGAGPGPTPWPDLRRHPAVGRVDGQSASIACAHCASWRRCHSNLARGCDSQTTARTVPVAPASPGRLRYWDCRTKAAPPCRYRVACCWWMKNRLPIKSLCCASWRALRRPPTGLRATKPITWQSRWEWWPCSG